MLGVPRSTNRYFPSSNVTNAEYIQTQEIRNYNTMLNHHNGKFIISYKVWWIIGIGIMGINKVLVRVG